MKLSSTTAIALALTVGLAGGALAQTTASPSPATNPTGAGQVPAGGQAAPAPMQQGANAQLPPNAAAPAATTQSVAGADPQVQQAQERLSAAGLYNGPQDGRMDPDTRMAIARFQDQHGLRRTENLDQATLAQLMGGQTTGFGSSAPSSATPAPGSPGYAGAGGSTAGSALVPPR